VANRNNNFCAFVCLTSIFVGSVAFVPKAVAADYDYPELLVTPRASERIDLEARKETESKWSRHVPVQVSAGTTFIAGIVQFGNVDDTNTTKKNSPWVGLAVGGGWLAATAILSAYYNPYASMNADVRALPSKTPREQLVRERMSEEAIEGAAAIGRRITWLSVLTNFGAATFMMASANASSAAKVTDGIAMAASLTPLLFPYRWQTVASEQSDYKKKIYAPVASFSVLPEASTGKAAPGLVLSLQF
jgi:hypothetical protein